MKKSIIFFAGCALLLAGCLRILDSSVSKKSCNVTFSAELQDGELTAQKDGVKFEGGVVPEGTVITFTAKPKAGFKVAKWTGGMLNESRDKRSAALTVTKDAHVKVIFSNAKKCKVTFADPSAGGTLEAHIKGGAEYASGIEIDEQSTIIFTAKPSTKGKGYYVEKWGGKGLQVSENRNTAELVVKENVTVTVTFREYDITNPNWFATGLLHDTSDHSYEVRLVINDGERYFSIFGLSGTSITSGMSYNKTMNTITLNQGGQGTITILSKSFDIPGNWKIKLTGVKIGTHTFKDEEVIVNVTLSNL